MVDFRNPLGLVNILDGGTPRIITGTANSDISGGELVKIVSNGPNVSSGADSYAATDIVFDSVGGIGSNFGGVALSTVSSGTSNFLAVARRGVFICPVWSGTAFKEIEAGHKVMPYSGGQVASVEIGRAHV